MALLAVQHFNLINRFSNNPKSGGYLKDFSIRDRRYDECVRIGYN